MLTWKDDSEEESNGGKLPPPKPKHEERVDSESKLPPFVVFLKGWDLGVLNVSLRSFIKIL